MSARVVCFRLLLKLTLTAISRASNMLAIVVILIQIIPTLFAAGSSSIPGTPYIIPGKRCYIEDCDLPMINGWYSNYTAYAEPQTATQDLEHRKWLIRYQTKNNMTWIGSWRNERYLTFYLQVFKNLVTQQISWIMVLYEPSAGKVK